LSYGGKRGNYTVKKVIFPKKIPNEFSNGNED